MTYETRKQRRQSRTRNHSPGNVKEHARLAHYKGRQKAHRMGHDEIDEVMRAIPAYIDNIPRQLVTKSVDEGFTLIVMCKSGRNVVISLSGAAYGIAMDVSELPGVVVIGGMKRRRGRLALVDNEVMVIFDGDGGDRQSLKEWLPQVFGFLTRRHVDGESCSRKSYYEGVMNDEITINSPMTYEEELLCRKPALPA